MDVLEAFVSIRAGPREAWRFLTQASRLPMWVSPLAEVHLSRGVATLDVGVDLDVVLNLPGEPAFNCTVLSLADNALECRFIGFVTGMSTWRVVPAGDGSIVHARAKCEVSDRRWMLVWALIGRWLGALVLAWLLRRLRDRIEDTVGSSTFGPPLPVTPYAVASSALVGTLVLGLLLLCAKRRGRDRR